MIAVLLITCTPLDARRYEIEELNNRPGLYFAKSFDFLLATESWTIAVDTNLKDLEEKLEQIEQIWQTTIQLKNYSIGSTWTDAHFQETRDAMKNAELRIARLYELTGVEPGPSRNRRGIFNSIGFGMKTLFGTMDHDDAEYFNEKISTLDSNQHRVYQMEKDQLTVVRHTLSDIQHTFRDFKTNQDTVVNAQHYLEQMQELLKQKFDSFQEQMSAHYRVIGALQIIDLICKDIDRVVTDLYISIDSMRHGSLSTLLITPDDFIKYLQAISNHLKTGSTLPFAVTENTVHLYYEIVRVRAWIVNKNVLRFFLNVPLKHNNMIYNLYQVLPVPIRTPRSNENCLFTYVQPGIRYLAVSKDETKFIPMTENNLEQCKGSSNTKICYGSFIVNNFSDDSNTCETAYYKRVEPLDNMCDHRIVYLSTSLWTEISKDKWIFVIPREELLTITCPGRDGQSELEGSEWTQGTGIITLPVMCEMKGSTFNIYKRVNFRTLYVQNISDSIRIPKPSKNVMKLENKTYDILFEHLKNSTNRIKYVSSSLNDLKTASIRLDTLNEIIKQYEPNNYVSSNVHYYSIMPMCILVIFLFYYFKLYRFCYVKKEKVQTLQITTTAHSRKNSVADVDEIPLEDRIKMSRKKSKNNVP